MLVVTLLAVGVLCWISGFVLGFLFHRKFAWVSAVINTLALIVIVIFWKWASRQIDLLDKQRTDLRKGARGEVVVGFILADLPESFCVINDLTTRFGNIDHVVVGPTGVFAIDTKTWRGIISADGKGELLLNGRPSSGEKAHVKIFVGRIMEVRDRVKALIPGFDLFIEGVFVFTSAFVDAKWGKTGNVNCLRDDQIHDYIADKKRLTKLTNQEIEKIARAFSALARMDADFSVNTIPKERTTVTAKSEI